MSEDLVLRGIRNAIARDPKAKGPREAERKWIAYFYRGVPVPENPREPDRQSLAAGENWKEGRE